MTLLFDTAIVKEGGADPVIESLNITPTAQQQVIEAPSGVDGYSPITVAAAAEPVIESLSVTPTASQQIIEAPSGVDGYSPITVAAVSQPVIQSLSITPSNVQQTFTASGGVDGYSPITVAAIPQDDEPEIQYVQNPYEGYKGSLILSSSMLKDLFVKGEEIQEGDDAYLALMTCGAYVEYDSNDQIIYFPSSIDVGYLFDYTQDFKYPASLEVDRGTRISNKPSKLYIQLYTNNSHGYLDIDITLPSDVSWYQRAWSCDVIYDDNEPSINLTNFQRIGE